MKIDIGNYVKYPKKRKIKIKIHNYDTYDLRSTLAIVIAASLKKFKKNKCGIPMFCFPQLEDYSPTEQEETIAKNNWDAILDSMIFAFDELAQEKEENKIYDMNLSPEQTKKELDELREKVQEGLDLFAKHYKSLWS